MRSCYRTTAFQWMLVCLTLLGCEKRDSGPSVQELVRRQRLRESAQLSKSRTLEERLANAESYLSQGNAVAAGEEIRSLLISHPDHRDLILLSARIQAASGDKIAAAKTLDAIDESDVESHREALWLAATWLIAVHRYDEAQQKLERMLEFPGDVHRVHRKLAVILNNQGRRIEAAPHLRALARLGEIREKELFAMNNYSNPFIDESMSKPDFGGKLIPAALVQAKLFRTQGKPRQARVLLERLSNAFPDLTQISAFQGCIYMDLQDEEQLRRWIQNTPDGIDREPEYWHVLGIWLQRQDRHREAVRCLAEAVKRDETDRYSYVALARSLKLLGEEDAAECARERFNLLTETAKIAKKIGLKRGTLEELNRMAEILQQLQRPWEAIAWRSIALKTFGAGEGELAALQQWRAATEESEGASEDTLICGLDLAQFPLSDVHAIGRSIATDPGRRPRRSAEDATIILRDVAAHVDLAFRYDNGDDPGDDLRLIHQLTGGGIGVMDIDLDGWIDLYFTQGGGGAFEANGSKPNQLFRNLAGQRFTSVTEPSQTGDRGYGQGVGVADINQDGFPDIVVANIGPNVFYRNNGDGTFARSVLSRKGHHGGWTTSIACGDLSGDQLPEIVEVNYLDDPSALTTPCGRNSGSCSPRHFQAAADHVWRVDAGANLSSWKGCRGIAEELSLGFAAVLANFDGKAGNDLFIANDTKHNHFWLSRAGDDAEEYELLESAMVYGCGAAQLGQPLGSMGVAHGDFDRNGKIDLHVTNFWNESASLYLQQIGGSFVPANANRGLYDESRENVGWGTQAVDFDRNGWLDLAVLNGHVQDNRHRGEPFEMRPQLFRGDAEGFQFVQPAAESDGYWSKPTLGRTMAVLDWNGDGRPDLLTNHLDRPVALLENQSECANSVQIELVGTVSERDATGATVTLTCGDQVFTGWVVGGDGFLCSNESVLDFGIGAARTIDRMEVSWPSGATQDFTGLSANQRYLVVEGDEKVFQRRSPSL